MGKDAMFTEDDEPEFASGTLAQRIAETSRRALASGHLVPYVTTSWTLADRGVEFAIRQLDATAHRQKMSVPADRPRPNPFLPYEEELFVAPITPQYIGLLNKYLVVSDHLLLVTREFVSQTLPLAYDDFLALAHVLRELDGLAFYNGGAVAGASQPHRHLQWIPLTLNEQGHRVPLDAILPRDSVHPHQWQSVHEIPFVHLWMPLAAGELARPSAWADAMANHFDQAVAHWGWSQVSEVTPYNLLVTRDWALFVPRRHERFEGISLNAMAFGGGILVRDPYQFEILRQSGPMQALMSTAGIYDPAEETKPARVT